MVLLYQQINNRKMENLETEVNLTEEQMVEQNIKAFQEAQAKMEAMRVPLLADTSTDTIQRIRCLVDVLSLKITVPKYVTETVNKQQFDKLVGSVELHMFPHYGNDERTQGYMEAEHRMLIDRIIKLANTL